MLGTREAAVRQPPTLDEFKRHTEQKLQGLICPDHRLPPKIKFRGATLREVTIQMSGCCATLLEMANRAIAERAP